MHPGPLVVCYVESPSRKRVTELVSTLLLWLTLTQESCVEFPVRYELVFTYFSYSKAQSASLFEKILLDANGCFLLKLLYAKA